MSVLEAPNYLGKTGTGTIFSIQTSSGKDIRAHSYFDNEDEILLPPEKPNFSESKTKSPYSNKKLDCNGRACVECGHCRDWYWRPNGDDKDYTKRDDATCTSDGYDRGFRIPFRNGRFCFDDDDDDDAYDDDRR
ncbi:unnamed protein product, partial [Rotaria sp. Silwood1]